MTNDTELLKKRFQELSSRADARGICVFSEFLNLYEQSLLKCEIRGGYELIGGHENPERCVACFLPYGEKLYEAESPIQIVKISPRSKKFADDLTHRDFLGSVLGLGIRRETVGDIVISDNKAYIICLDSVADFIVQNLSKVRHTSVKCELCEALPKADEMKPKPLTVNIASERLDALIAAVYNISRSKSADLCKGEKVVFINGKLTPNGASTLKNGDIVSVRGVGRFVFCEILGETRKHRLRAKVEAY